MKKDTFYVTTPIYYVNSKPHLGTVYSTVAADIIARFKRMQGKDVFFLTGSDEHGEKVALTAKKHNKEPKEWVDEIVASYKLLWDRLNISYNKFIRTTDKEHEKTVAKILEILKEKNLIYEGSYTGLYCLECERFYTKKELVDNKCPFHQKDLVNLKEKCYFLKLSAFQKPLIKLIEEGEFRIEPEKRKNEILGFLTTERLEDVAISREKVKWGVQIPWDREQTVYVWVDALINYLSGLGWKGDPKKTSKYWPPDCQIIGKDILRFHTLLWGAIILSLEIPLPKLIFVHGFLTLEGQKMSKSLGNVIEPDKLIDIFGSDATRYLLFSFFSFGEDCDISLSKFYDEYNAKLANGYGNLISRTLTLALGKGEIKLKKVDKKFEKKVSACWRDYDASMEGLKFNQALEVFQALIAFCNEYIDKKKPWELLKKDKEGFEEVIYNLTEAIRHLNWMILPFMPEKANQIFELLGLGKTEYEKSRELAKEWAEVKVYKISEKIERIFPRL